MDVKIKEEDIDDEFDAETLFNAGHTLEADAIKKTKTAQPFSTPKELAKPKPRTKPDTSVLSPSTIEDA